MDIGELTRHICDAYGAEAEYLFRHYPELCVFRRPDNRKWFAAAKPIPRRSLGLEQDGEVEILNVKCDPILLGSLRGVSSPSATTSPHRSPAGKGDLPKPNARF